MTNPPKLVYVTRIRTTPTKLWQTLTDSDFIQQYWLGCRNTSTWKVGDIVESRDPNGELSWYGRILKSLPEEEVVFTFDHLTDEPPSTVRVKIVPLQVTVQLTITHEDFLEVSAIRDRVKNGWPSIIVGIDSLLETGSVENAPSSCTKQPAGYPRPVSQTREALQVSRGSSFLVEARRYCRAAGK